MLLVGYFEGIDSQRGIAWRCADSLALRQFLGIPLSEATMRNIRQNLFFAFIYNAAGIPIAACCTWGPSS